MLTNYNMATVKIVLRKERRQDGTFPLQYALLRTVSPPSKYLNYSINKKDWNEKEQCVKKSHPNSGRPNSYLRIRLADATNGALEVESKKSDASAKGG